MARSVQLLLTENVDNLGIVGDVVKVRQGYARNYLLPRSLATTPSEEKIQALAAKRADAERMLAELRRQREEMIGKLNGQSFTMVRSCNDQGILYASVTQQEIADLLGAGGYAVKAREVRIPGAIKRIDHYEVHVRVASDLEAAVTLHVNADRELDLRRDEEPEPAPAPEGAQAGAQGDGGEAPAGGGTGRGRKGERAEGAGEPPAAVESVWGKKVDKGPVVESAGGGGRGGRGGRDGDDSGKDGKKKRK